MPIVDPLPADPLLHGSAFDRLQRATGLLRLDVGTRALRSCVGRPTVQSCIVSLRQQGCFKLLFPRVEVDAPLQAVTVNTSGGIAAGDRLESFISCAGGTHLVLTAQAAERCYRARPGEAPSHVAAEVRLEANARLEWLPQETILFEGARLHRRLVVEMDPDASFLGLESRVFGRALRGERVHSLDLSDRIIIRRGGRPVLVDGLELHGDAQAALSRPAIGKNAIASAMIVLVAPDAESFLHPVRRLLTEMLASDTGIDAGVVDAGAVDAGVSGWNGMLLVRLVSKDASRHRTLIAAVLSILRSGAPLPAVWRS